MDVTQPAPAKAAGFVRYDIMRTRPEFLAAARGRKAVMPSMIVQAHQRRDDETVNVGFTCSKKVGNAVARNRAKRRLRAAAHAVLTTHARPGWDYVLIGRAKITDERPFDLLISDLTEAVSRLHT